jgi:hypothetical protein
MNAVDEAETKIKVAVIGMPYRIVCDLRPHMFVIASIITRATQKERLVNYTSVLLALGLSCYAQIFALRHCSSTTAL